MFIKKLNVLTFCNYCVIASHRCTQAYTIVKRLVCLFVVEIRSKHIDHGNSTERSKHTFIKIKTIGHHFVCIIILWFIRRSRSGRAMCRQNPKITIIIGSSHAPLFVEISRNKLKYTWFGFSDFDNYIQTQDMHLFLDLQKFILVVQWL